MKRKAIAMAAITTALVAGCSKQAELDAANNRIRELESQLALEKAKSEELGGKVAAVPISPVAASPTPKAAAEALVVKTPEPAATDTIGHQWRYAADEDKMTSATTYNATVSSTNTVEFGFPYSGTQHGELLLRTHPRYGKDVIFSIERGQILCPSYDGCSVKVRFDDEKPVNFSANAPADHSTEYVFLEGYDRFIGKLQKAKTVRISVNVYQQGSPVFEFDVSGFEPEKYKPKKK